MKKFKFNLEAVSKHRQWLQDEAHNAFSKAKMYFLEGVHELAGIEQEEKNQREHLKENQRGKLDLETIILNLRYLMHLSDKKEVKEKDVAVREQEMEQKKEVLISVVKDKKVIEKLREKKRRVFLKETITVEQKSVDESAMNTFARKEKIYEHETVKD